MSNSENGRKAASRDSIVAQSIHKEMGDDPMTLAKSLVLGGSQIVKYRYYKEAKYRIMHRVEPIFAEKWFNGLNSKINRNAAEINVGVAATLWQMTANSIIGKKAEAMKAGEKAKIISMLDVKHIRAYIRNPQKFIHQYGAFADPRAIKQVYDENLSSILHDVKKKRAFLNLEKYEERLAYLNENLPNNGYKKIILSQSHNELIIRKIASGNEVIKTMLNYEQKSRKLLGEQGKKFAATGAGLLYDFYNYDGLDAREHPIKNVVEDRVIGAVVGECMVAIVGLAGSLPVGVLCLVTWVVPILVEGEIKEMLDDYDFGEVLDNATYLKCHEEIMNDETKTSIYNAICLFFKKYIEMTNKFNFKFLQEKGVKKEEIDILKPREIMRDRLDPVHFVPPPHQLRIIPLNDENNILLAARTIRQYQKQMELGQVVEESYRYKKSLIYSYAESTGVNRLKQLKNKLDKESPKLDGGNLKTRNLVQDDLADFHAALANWDVQETIYVPEEFSGSVLFSFLEPFL